MFEERKMVTSLRLAFHGGLTGLAVLTTPVLAQTVDSGVQKGERVEVTGSSIKRIDAETALPVQVITRQDINRLAPQNVEDLLKTISATSVVGGTQLSTGSGATTSGVSSVSLRGLGATAHSRARQRSPRGAVRRQSRTGGGVAAVDINSIPLAAIERVEVLKDGASAIYGSDAVAGVVNFILRSDYQGALIEGLYGQTTHSATGKSYQSDVLLGYGDLQRDRFNAMLTASYNKENAIYGRDRYFANTGVQRRRRARTRRRATRIRRTSSRRPARDATSSRRTSPASSRRSASRTVRRACRAPLTLLGSTTAIAPTAATIPPARSP